MIIGFNPEFVPKIISGTKIHTIRDDEHDRWKPGMTMHMATGVRTKNYNQFHTSTCVSFQKILIYPTLRQIAIIKDANVHEWLCYDNINLLAKNDGFDSTTLFWMWFLRNHNGKPKKLIHWTNLTYPIPGIGEDLPY
jgi:hypothetical protein